MNICVFSVEVSCVRAVPAPDTACACAPLLSLDRATVCSQTTMQAALEHVRAAVAFDAKGEIAQAIVAYEAGIAAMKQAAAIAPLDAQTHAFVWGKIGEYYARAEELKVRIAVATPAHVQQQQQPTGARLEGLKAFHADLESGAVAGGYGKDQLRERLDALRGRPSAVSASKNSAAADATWLQEEAPSEDEQIDMILRSARDEAALERGTGDAQPDTPQLEERFYRQLKKDVSEAGPAPNQSQLLREADMAVREAANALGHNAATQSTAASASVDVSSDEESDSGEYSDEAMEKRRQKEKAHRRQLRAKAKARMHHK